MNARPYIGITGITTTDEIAQLTGAYARLRDAAGAATSNHLLMLGILSSEKRLADRGNGSTQAPAFDAVPGLLERIAAMPSDVLPMLHHHTPEPATVVDDLRTLFEHRNIYRRGLCRAVQLNVAWPNPCDLEAIKNDYPDLAIVVQLPRRALELVPDREALNGRLRSYDGLADYVLYDLSGGKGEYGDASDCAATLERITRVLPSTVPGAAGGLDGTNAAHFVRTIRDVYRRPFCIDAQGRLRTEDRTRIDPEKAQSYLLGAVAGFSS